MSYKEILIEVFGDADPTIPIDVKLSDVNLEEANHAYEGTSWTPEERGKRHQIEYLQDMQSAWDIFHPFIEKYPELLEIAKTELERYKSGYLSHLRAWLGAKSRVVSSFIAGPSKFPSRTMEKRNETESRRLNEFIEWRAKALKAMTKSVKDHIRGKRVEFAGGEANLIKARIQKLQDRQELMKSANKIIRKSISDEEKIKALMALGISESNARKLLLPDFAGRVGFPDYELKNNLAEIRRLKLRAIEMEANETQNSETLFKGGKVVDAGERIQIFFDVKPPSEMIKQLQQKGFHYSRANNAWQRMRTNATRNAVQEILGIKLNPFFDVKSPSEMIKQLHSEMIEQLQLQQKDFIRQIVLKKIRNESGQAELSGIIIAVEQQLDQENLDSIVKEVLEGLEEEGLIKKRIGDETTWSIREQLIKEQQNPESKYLFDKIREAFAFPSMLKSVIKKCEQCGTNMISLGTHGIEVCPNSNCITNQIKQILDHESRSR